MKTKLFKTLSIAFMAMLLSVGSAYAVTPRKSASHKARTSVSAKRGAKKKTVKKPLAVVKGERKNYSNGLVTEAYSCKKGAKNIYVEFPVEGDPALVNVLRTWICGNLNSKTVVSDPSVLMRKLISVNDGTVEYIDSIKVAYDNGKVLTMLDSGYEYAGGAHGMPWQNYATFLISDGTQFTADMLPPVTKFKPLLMKGFARYYDVPVSEVKEYFFDSDSISDMGTPYIDANGLNIIYAPYEIAPYSSGFPTSIISVGDIMPYLGSSAKRFF